MPVAAPVATEGRPRGGFVINDRVAVLWNQDRSGRGDWCAARAIRLGRGLYEALPSPRKRFVEFADTGHNDVPYRDPERYLSEVAQFLAEEVEGGQ